jgi:dTDP-glucose 4,6-dehydratase
MTTILVTGGAGFIGSNFVHFLRRERPHWHLINLDLLTYAGNAENLAGLAQDPGYTFVRGDVADWACVSELFARHPIDRVAHFAAESHVDRSILDPGVFVRTNVVGTYTLIEAARQAWGREPDFGGARFLHVSTDEVYGSLSLSDPPTTETSAYAPSSPYAASKAASDWLVRSYVRTYKFPALITNCSNNYGPYQFPEKLIPLVLSQALAGKPIPIYGKGDNIRDWLYVEDHCRAVLQVLEEGTVGETYNIGAEGECTNLEIVRLLLDILGELRPDLGDVHRLVTFVTDRPGHDFRYALNIDKIGRTLGWRPSVPLAEGLRRTISWYLDHQGWLDRVRTGEYRRYLEQQYHGSTD